ncbi:carbohydrate ABC transporter permease [Mahella australiensis]|uniref:Binding-protein-dependent transport systems inner membrane component n=1 Tax=Mahella australiensis (strain DSM 15567 / CIP 107919 / 50-1 BON) TaxID=697281 RepID=F4A252_MAHA5|nr:sugar ABC transporter permease [Mahella australiensis]AEE97191.1 binding-protein-dependent transport systems inner membrane component [Mahella australiensis 50-1 BON]
MNDVIKSNNKKHTLGNDNLAGYIMIAPFYVFMLIFVLVPIIINIFLSFTNYNFTSGRFIGFDNYINIFTDDIARISFRNTIVYTLFNLPITMVLSMLLANLMNSKIKGISIYRTTLFLPHAVSMVAVSMIWIWIYDPMNGYLNNLLKLFGIQGRQWLYDPNTALGSIIAMSIWKTTGYYMIIYLAGLQGIPSQLYEAATIDGAGSIQKFRHITVPMLRPITFFIFVTGMIQNFNVFEQVNVMTGGGPMNSTTTIMHQIYIRAFNDYLMGYSAALSVILLIVVSAITLINLKYGSQGTDLELD